MAIKLTDDNHYKNIANAIRTKTGTENKYKPGEMAAAIRGITTGSTAYGTLTIRTNTPENETVDVANFASVIVDVPASAVVSGNKEITSNGSNIDVESYRTVSVNVVPDPPTREMTLNINEDHVDVRDVGFVNVRVPASVADTLGDKPIDSNGTHTVVGYSTVTVDVPSGGSPSGTINLNHNGTFNVSNVAQAIVDVKASSVTMGTTDPIYANGIVNVEEYKYANVQVRPENVDVGSTTISTNGEHNVVGYASVMVTVPTGAVPTGAKNITENGVYDVINDAQVTVNVGIDSLLEHDTMRITDNIEGLDVSTYRYVTVDVAASSVATQVKTIDYNGDNIDVASCRAVNVRVPASVADTLGRKIISTNGLHDVTGYSEAEVYITSSASSGNIGMYISDDGGIVISSAGTGSVTIMTGDE